VEARTPCRAAGSAAGGAMMRLAECPLSGPVSAEATCRRFHEIGFAIVPDVISPTDCSRLLPLIERPAEGRAGSRAMLRMDWCRELALALSRHPSIAPLLPPGSVPVQCTLFEKSAEKNWLVAFHQDQSIPVAEATDSRGRTGWSVKDGLTFVQAPPDVLAQMVALRLQLDAPDGSDGALRVIPGSHRNGKVLEAEIDHFRAAQAEVTCRVEQGGVLVMRPLLLHASSKIVGSQPRRVLHFLFGPAALPHGLRWPEC